MFDAEDGDTGTVGMSCVCNYL